MEDLPPTSPPTPPPPPLKFYFSSPIQTVISLNIAAKMRLTALVVAVQCFAFSYGLPSILDLLASNNATTALQLINQAGLADTLRQGGPFTALIPTDAAFAKIPAADLAAVGANTQALTNVLQYHLINGDIFTWDLKTNELLTSLNGHVVRVYTRNGAHYFNQAKAVKEEVQASNGVVYFIDEVLAVPEGTIYSILGNPSYNISMFKDLVDLAHFNTTLDRTSTLSRYTVFAPSNAAISSLPDSVVQRIKSSRTYARLLIEYHIHSGTLHAGSLSKPGSLTTLYGGHYIGLTLDSNGGPELNNVAHVTLADIEAENGVVHVISHVLIPSSLAGIIG